VGEGKVEWRGRANKSAKASNSRPEIETGWKKLRSCGEIQARTDCAAKKPRGKGGFSSGKLGGEIGLRRNGNQETLSGEIGFRRRRMGDLTRRDREILPPKRNPKASQELEEEAETERALS
jgi:hypothetical protein